MLFNITFATFLTVALMYLLPVFILKLHDEWSPRKQNIILVFASLIFIVMINIIIEAYLHSSFFNAMTIYGKGNRTGGYISPQEVFQAIIWFFMLFSLMQLIIVQKINWILPIIGLIGIAIFARSILLDYSMLNPQECPAIMDMIFDNGICKNRYDPEVYLDLISQQELLNSQ